MENPELGSASVLNQWENEGKKLTKWELSRVVKELRKYKRFERALEVKQMIIFRQSLDAYVGVYGLVLLGCEL